jgi:hydrogenase nickel incorporation protein HypB
MCKDCGCQTANEKMHKILSGHSHSPPTLNLSTAVFKTTSPVLNASNATHTLTVEERVLAKNDKLAKENRAWFDRHHMKAINMISSPGAGKTYLLERTLELVSRQEKKSGQAKDSGKITILTGDLERDYDAQRLAAKGGKVKQLNTLSSCHLDAAMISKELDTFVERDTNLLIIENVGNLVCPAAFDLGEHEKVALLSTTEGEDKPSKYPLLFHTASLIVITKIDLVPYLDWSLEKCVEHIRKVNPTAPILKLSAKTGEGMNAWLDYLTP